MPGEVSPRPADALSPEFLCSAGLRGKRRETLPCVLSRLCSTLVGWLAWTRAGTVQDAHADLAAALKQDGDRVAFELARRAGFL